MSRLLNDLDPRFRPLAVEFLAQLTEQGIHVLIVCTRRTEAEQIAAVKAGTSKVAHSRHEDGMAIDVCPYAQWALHGPAKLQWDDADPVWRQIGQVGERLGLRWGGRFAPLNRVGMGWDAGHFELPEKFTRSGEIV